MFVSFNACSSDDDDKKENLIIGKWKENDSSLSDILEFKADGTFQYTSSKEADYEEHGIWKIESGDKLYYLFSDEDIWSADKILEVTSTSLILQEYEEDNTTLSEDYKKVYQRIK